MQKKSPALPEESGASHVDADVRAGEARAADAGKSPGGYPRGKREILNIDSSPVRAEATRCGLDFSILQMEVRAMVYEGFEPEAVEMLDRALDLACARAAQRTPVNDGVRSLLATAVLNGVRQGIQDPEQLANFALPAIPAFRHAS